MDCTTTLEISGAQYVLHLDFEAFRRLVQTHDLPITPMYERLKKFDVVAAAAVLLEGLEGGRRLDPKSREKPWKLAEAEALTEQAGYLEICPQLVGAIATAIARPKKDEGGAAPDGGKAPTG